MGESRCLSILPDVLNSRTPPCHVSSAAVPSILIKGLELPNPNTLYLILPVFENDLVFVFVVPGIEHNRSSQMLDNHSITKL